MSFMDKLKSLFSGGSEGSSASHEAAEMPSGGREAEAPMDMPATPADPMGTPMPPAGGMENESDSDDRM